MAHHGYLRRRDFPCSLVPIPAESRGITWLLGTSQERQKIISNGGNRSDGTIKWNVTNSIDRLRPRFHG